MAIRSPDSTWRLLLAVAPLAGLAMLGWAALSHGSARSSTAWGLLALLGLGGAAMAGWTARQLRRAPALPIATAATLWHAGTLPAVVALRGSAHALPGAAPLQSPRGVSCLWFAPPQASSAPGAGRPAVGDARPFLLVDDSGTCAVLPAGAVVAGRAGSEFRDSTPGSMLGQSDLDAAAPSAPPERLLLEGDRLQVVGRYVPASAASVAGLREALAGPVSLRSNAGTASGATPVPELPLLVAPGPAVPLRMTLGAPRRWGDLHGGLAVANVLVALAAAAGCAWMALAHP